MVEKAKQKPTPDTQNNSKGSPSSSSSCCEKVNGVHQNGADVVLQSRHTSEQSQQRKNHVTNGKEEKKPAQQKKTEPQQQGKQPEVSNEGCASRKKLSHADQEVGVSRQDSRKTCNGKENNILSRRKAEEKSKKKRQEPVAPFSVSVSDSVSAPEPATVEKNDGDKSKCGGRKQQQKKQGKKKASLGEVLETFGNVGTNTSHSSSASSLTSLDVSLTYSDSSPLLKSRSTMCAIDQYPVVRFENEASALAFH